jgi:hypothetical protein
MGYGLGDQSSIADGWKRVFSTQPPIQWVQRVLSPRLKWQGREGDQSPPSSAEVKKDRAIRPLLRMSSWRDVSLIKHIFTSCCLYSGNLPFVLQCSPCNGDFLSRLPKRTALTSRDPRANCSQLGLVRCTPSEPSTPSQHPSQSWDMI